jgi:cohesin loading factor subunit SCC2
LVLGFICQYHETNVDAEMWENELDRDQEPVPPNELTWKNTMLACYRIFSKFLVKEDAPTKCSALEAFGCMFVTQPRLLLSLEQMGLIEAVMADQAHESLQLVSLQCWKKILLAEEKRVDSGKAQIEMDANEDITLAQRISGDQDGDATLFGSVLTNHAQRLFEMTQSADRNVRFASLELLGLLLRQGLVNPNEAVPFLFALRK